MNIPQQFTTEVDECLDQAVAEGWVGGRTTTATVAITIAVLVARFEAMDDGAVLTHTKNCLRAALDLVS